MAEQLKLKKKKKCYRIIKHREQSSHQMDKNVCLFAHSWTINMYKPSHWVTFLTQWPGLSIF